jgi:hypothetical protein
MNTFANRWHHRAYVTAVTLATVAVVSCGDDSVATRLQTLQSSSASDTVSGTGQLAELQERRATWVARKIDNYQFRLRISCFCAGEITHPVLIEVRQGAVATVLDLETGRPVTDKSRYLSITGLFDAAIAERSRGGHVSAAYDRVIGIPVRLEVGTIANDAGLLYYVSSFIASS